MSGVDPVRQRIEELVADKAMGELTPADERELARLTGPNADRDVQALELAMAKADAAMHHGAGTSEPLPRQVAESLEALAQKFAGAAPSRVAEPRVVEVAEEQSLPERPMAYMNWTEQGQPNRTWWRLAIAAVLAIAVGLGLYMAARPSVATPTDGRLAMLGAGGDMMVADWTDWKDEQGAPPDISGVKGDVVWSDLAQKGYMRFVGLPKADPKVSQYQLWIIDAERGMSQRISGGIFSGDDSGECVVAIEPGLQVKKAAAFAITIEQPGGTWVSDMKHRVVIASRP